jgi:hypothetical protein
MRVLYQSVLRLHPLRFRRRFAEEMMLVFDDSVAARGGIWLTLDAVFSLLRQWILRADYWHSPTHAELAVSVSGVPRFATLERSSIRAGSAALGAVLTVTIFAGIPFFATYGRQLPEDDPWSNWPRERWMNPTTGEIGLLSAFVAVRPDTESDRSGVRAAMPAERRLMEWLESYNTGQWWALRAFYRRHWPTWRVDASIAEKAVREWHTNFQRSGALRVQALTQYGRYAVFAICEGPEGSRWSIMLVVEDSYPNRILAFRMAAGSRGAAEF